MKYIILFDVNIYVQFNHYNKAVIILMLSFIQKLCLKETQIRVCNVFMVYFYMATYLLCSLKVK